MGRPRFLVRVPAAIVLAATLAIVVIGLGACGGEKGDFPGSWTSARGSKIVITAASDGDYDVMLKDPNTQRGEDMTFQAKRNGDKLTIEYQPGEEFFTLTLHGDKMDYLRQGGYEVYLRDE